MSQNISHADVADTSEPTAQDTQTGLMRSDSMEVQIDAEQIHAAEERKAPDSTAEDRDPKMGDGSNARDHNEMDNDLAFVGGRFK
jgi:hypothetical protein